MEVLTQRCICRLSEDGLKCKECSTVYPLDARPDVLKGSLPITLTAVKLTYFGAPRVSDKIVEGIKAKGKAAEEIRTVYEYICSLVDTATNSKVGTHG